MGELISKVAPLAIVGAISPTVFLATVVILSGRRPLLRVTAFAAGIATTTLLVALTGVFLLGRAVSTHHSRTSHLIDIAVGVVLLILAAVAAARPAKKTSQEAPGDRGQPEGDRVRLVPLYLGGVALMATNFSSIMPLLVASKDIGEATVPAPEKALVLIAAIAVIMAPVLVPALIVAIFPRQSDTLLGGLRRFLDRWGKWVVVAVFAVLGVYLVVRGVLDLGQA